MNNENLENFFSKPTDYRYQANLSWQFDIKRSTEIKFYVLGKAYMQTSKNLIYTCINDNVDGKANTWILPILFSTIHAIELYLKGLNSHLKILKKYHEDDLKLTKIEGNHDIKQLCEETISLLKKLSYSDMLKDYMIVKKFINYLYMFTEDMSFARYPIDKKKSKSQFYVDSNSPYLIDLTVFCQWLECLSEIFENSSSYIINIIELEKERLLNECEEL